MAFPLWRARLFPAPEDSRLASWLTEPGSLTARCERACRRFRVRVLAQGRARSFADAAAARGPLPAAEREWVREVALECDGVPVIYAHTVLAATPRGRMTRWLAGLGSRSLGTLLFAHPGFRRGPIEFQRLDARHPLFRRAVRAGGGEMPLRLWARRSAHRLGGQAVLVTEVFLPAILRLEA